MQTRVPAMLILVGLPWAMTLWSRANATSRYAANGQTLDDLQVLRNRGIQTISRRCVGSTHRRII